MKRARDAIHILTPEFSGERALRDEIHRQNVYLPSAPVPDPPPSPPASKSLLEDFSTMDEEDIPAELRACVGPGRPPLTLRARLPKRLDFRPDHVDGEPLSAESFVALLPEDDIFAHCFGADVDLAHSPFTLDENMVLGALGVLGRLLVVSPVLRALYTHAPDAPHLQFHHVNVMLGALKCASRRGGGPLLRTRLQQTLAFVIKAFDWYAPPEVTFPGKERLLMRYLYPLQLLLGLAPRLTVDFVCTEEEEENDEEEEDPEHHWGVRVEGLMVDALRIAPDEDAVSLADLMRDFEDQLSPASATCNYQHAYERRSLSYGPRGPPPLLFFEAECLQRGMPLHLLREDTLIMLGDHCYHFAVAALRDMEEDIVIQTLPTATAANTAVLVLLVYTRST